MEKAKLKDCLQIMKKLPPAKMEYNIQSTALIYYL
jgi:hypothetical protein